MLNIIITIIIIIIIRTIRVPEQPRPTFFHT